MDPQTALFQQHRLRLRAVQCRKTGASERERVALAWAEALTRLNGHDAMPDTAHAQASA